MIKKVYYVKFLLQTFHNSSDKYVIFPVSCNVFFGNLTNKICTEGKRKYMLKLISRQWLLQIETFERCCSHGYEALMSAISILLKETLVK